MCADCHSTNLHKNYDLKTREYNTTWSEIDVGCEACHGPASSHIAWSELKEEGGEYKSLKNKGFSIAFNERKNVEWLMNAETGSALRAQEKTTNIEIETCAQCHSRRGAIRHGARPGDALLDNFKVSLLTEQLYHVDGQIDGEVYVYGSFVQSKMYHAGVTCSDCHEPHSLKLRAEDNDLCAQCHLPEKYNTEQHHLHKDEHRMARNVLVVICQKKPIWWWIQGATIVCEYLARIYLYESLHRMHVITATLTNLHNGRRMCWRKNMVHLISRIMLKHYMPGVRGCLVQGIY